MNRRIALLLVLLFVMRQLPAAADPPDEADPEGSSAESQKFEGTWKLVSLVRDGNRLEPDQFDNMRLIFSESEYTYKNQQGKRMVGSYKVRSGKALPDKGKLPVLQTTYAEEPAEGKTVLRVYEWVDKDTLKLCSPGPDEKVPDALEAPRGSGRELATWKRVEEK